MQLNLVFWRSNRLWGLPVPSSRVPYLPSKAVANDDAIQLERALGPGGQVFFLTLDCKLACPERFELSFPMHLRKGLDAAAPRPLSLEVSGKPLRNRADYQDGRVGAGLVVNRYDLGIGNDDARDYPRMV